VPILGLVPAQGPALSRRLISFLNLKNIKVKKKSKAQRPRSVFFQIIFCGRGLDRLGVICHTKISIVEKSSFNQKCGFLLL